MYVTQNCLQNQQIADVLHLFQKSKTCLLLFIVTIQVYSYLDKFVFPSTTNFQKSFVYILTRINQIYPVFLRMSEIYRSDIVFFQHMSWCGTFLVKDFYMKPTKKLNEQIEINKYISQSFDKIITSSWWGRCDYLRKLCEMYLIISICSFILVSVWYIFYPNNMNFIYM